MRVLTKHHTWQIQRAIFLLAVGSAAFSIGLSSVHAKPQPWISRSLPAKKSAKNHKQPKKVFIDFTKPIASPNTGEERVQSRIIIPAPQGDLSEIFPTATPVPQKAKPAAPKIIATPVASPTPIVFTEPQIINVEKNTPSTAPLTMDDLISDPPQIESTLELETLEKKSSPPKSLANTLTFFRTGYLDAHYKKFDNRMKDGATYIGLGAAHSFQTSWGEFEARASLDIYHAMDQSTSIDNVRMFSTRTEVAYWITKSRVRPALTLGLGWADYAVKSYRSITNDSEGQLVTTRTHAKSQAFAIIPGSSLRIEVNDDIVIDTQTEFLGLLGGDSSDKVQGLSFGISLGWRL